MPDEAPFPIPDPWTLDREAEQLRLELETKDFMEAIRLVNQVAEVAEDLQHHPDIHLTEWNQLVIATWSHDVGGLTDRDERLAKAITALLRREGSL